MAAQRSRPPSPGDDESGDSGSRSSRSAQSGGELSGLLRQADELQKEIERAHQALASESVRGQDASGIVTIQITGAGAPQQIRISGRNLSEQERKALEDAFQSALKSTLDRWLELRRSRLSTVLKGMKLPNLFM